MKTASEVVASIFDNELSRAESEALITAYAEERLAQRDLEQFGEGFMLGGKRIGPNEIYKSTADCVREARAEALEEAAKLAENTPIHILRSQSHEGLRLSIADAIRVLKGKP